MLINPITSPPFIPRELLTANCPTTTQAQNYYKRRGPFRNEHFNTFNDILLIVLIVLISRKRLFTDALQNEDHLKKEDYLKNEDDQKYVDKLKNEDYLKHEDDPKNGDM